MYLKMNNLSIINPLEMENTYFSFYDALNNDKPYSLAYEKYDGIFQRTYYSESVTYFRGAGGMFSTTSDYAKIIFMLLNNGTYNGHEILTPAMAKFAVTPHELYSKRGCLWALFSEPLGNEIPEFGHAGYLGTKVWALPDKDLVILYFIQCRGNTTGKAKKLVLEAYGY